MSSNKTAIINLNIQIADDFVKRTSLKSIIGVPVNDNVVSQAIAVRNGIPVTLPGNTNADLTIISSSRPIKVSALLNSQPVSFPLSIVPLILSGPVTNIALEPSGSDPVDVFILQGA